MTTVARAWYTASLAALLLNSSCYAYHITGNRVSPSTEARSETQVAYFWGLMQPNDIVPANCPEKVALADVTVHTNLGYVLLGTVTLGIVLAQQIEWRCAKPDSGPHDVLRAEPRGGRG